MADARVLAGDRPSHVGRDPGAHRIERIGGSVHCVPHAGTSRQYAHVVPDAEAERAVARVRAVHRRVVGVAPDGRPYAANDPHLLRWVHVAEVDSFLAAHQRYGETPLSTDERDEYVRDMAVIARALGVPAPPESERALHDQIRAFRPELQGTAAAREAARYMLLQPPMHPAIRPMYTVLGSAAVALLPRWARWPLRLPSLPVLEAVAVRPAGDALVRGLRWALSGSQLPDDTAGDG